MIIYFKREKKKKKNHFSNVFNLGNNVEGNRLLLNSYSLIPAKLTCGL